MLLNNSSSSASAATPTSAPAPSASSLPHQPLFRYCHSADSLYNYSIQNHSYSHSHSQKPPTLSPSLKRKRSAAQTSSNSPLANSSFNNNLSNIPNFLPKKSNSVHSHNGSQQHSRHTTRRSSSASSASSLSKSSAASTVPTRHHEGGNLETKTLQASQPLRTVDIVEVRAPRARQAPLPQALLSAQDAILVEKNQALIVIGFGENPEEGAKARAAPTVAPPARKAKGKPTADGGRGVSENTKAGKSGNARKREKTNGGRGNVKLPKRKKRDVRISGIAIRTV
ncbi:hypothetical protein BJ742DRAFT_766454 [Cladochytrium replicatum]|nr:hypothetical protein BJ742DRAFT_766454 [Cladochytrium replicatum]